MVSLCQVVKLIRVLFTVPLHDVTGGNTVKQLRVVLKSLPAAPGGRNGYARGWRNALLAATDCLFCVPNQKYFLLLARSLRPRNVNAFKWLANVTDMAYL